MLYKEGRKENCSHIWRIRCNLDPRNNRGGRGVFLLDSRLNKCGKTFKRGIKLIVPVHVKVWGTVHYERMPHICFFCVHISHTLKQCELASESLSEDEKGNLGYGEWMAADMESSILISTCFVKIPMD